MRTDTNERAEIKELRGVASESLRGALCEMEAVASGTRATKPFYHASINTRADEPLTDAQRVQAIDRLENALGLSGQSRVVVIHLKEGREHCHIVWSRIDLDRMRAISDSHNYRKHEMVARELEREFGHERVQGAHIEREGRERPERTPSHSEMLQTSRGAVSPAEAKALISGLWQQTDNGKSFKAALEDQGWILARGDRRDFVAIDPNSGTHSLARRVAGAKATDVRERMADIDEMSLPTVAEARSRQREQLARSQGTSVEYRSLGELGINHEMTVDAAFEIAQRDSQNDREKAPLARQERSSGLRAATAATNADQTELEQLQVKQKVAEVPAIARTVVTGKDDAGATMMPYDHAAESDDRTLRGDTGKAFTAVGTETSQTRQGHLAEENNGRQDARRERGEARNEPRRQAPPLEQGLRVVDTATGAVSRLGDFVSNLLAGSSRPSPVEGQPAYSRDPAERTAQRHARIAAQQQARVAEHAIERMSEDMEAGRNLKADDIRSLTPQHQAQIALLGDAAVRQMVEGVRQRNNSHWRGDERERDW